MDNSSDSSSQQPWLEPTSFSDLPQQPSINIHDDSTIQQTEHPYHKSYQKSVQLMMIYFKHYQTVVRQVAAAHRCRVLFGMETLTLQGESEEKVERCYWEVMDVLPREGNLLRIQIGKPKDMRIYMGSPWRLKLLAEKNCHITAYQKNIIYLDSLTLKSQQLEEIKKMISPNNTFCVCFRDSRHSSPYYHHLAVYLAMVIDSHKDKWKDFNANAEISTKQDAVMVTAQEAKTRFALKNTCRKYLQQMMALVLKPKFDSKTIKSYLKKAVDYPFLVQTVNNTLLIITKDHIMSKLFTKDKFSNALLHSNSIGLLMMKQREDCSKEDLVRKIADQLDYRVVRDDNVMYFRADVEEGDKGSFAVFMQRFINRFMQTAEKFTLTVDLLQQETRKRQEEKKPKLITKSFYEPGDYLLNSETLELRQKFGCDLRMMRVLLNHKYLSEYNDLDGEEQKDVLFTCEDWCNQKTTQIVKIEFQKMRGQYFYGKVKRVRDRVVYRPEFLVIVCL